MLFQVVTRMNPVGISADEFLKRLPEGVAYMNTLVKQGIIEHSWVRVGESGEHLIEHEPTGRKARETREKSMKPRITVITLGVSDNTEVHLTDAARAKDLPTHRPVPHRMPRRSGLVSA